MRLKGILGGMNLATSSTPTAVTHFWQSFDYKMRFDDNFCKKVIKSRECEDAKAVGEIAIAVLLAWQKLQPDSKL